MQKLWGSVAIAALLAASGAYADPAPTTGVLTYDQAFFADSRPSTAYDMIKRLPGFTFDIGDSARGFAGTAGNVLIDGQRPTSKTDTLDSIISRIPATDVDHIDIIRGGAPGIDMQGRTVVANIIRKKASSTTIVADISDNFFLRGETVPNASLQLTSHQGDSTYEASASRYGSLDDSVGLGRRTITDSLGNLLQEDQENRRAIGFGYGFTGAMDVPAWGGRFKANILYQSTPFRSDLTFTSPGYLSDIISRTGSQGGELGAHWNGNISNLEVETLALERLGRDSNFNVFTDNSTVPPTDQRFLSTDKTSESIVRGTARYHASPTLTLEGGGEIAYNYLQGTSSFTDGGVPIAVPDANVTVDEKRGEIFGQSTWKITPDLVFESGARFEFSTISESGDTKQSRTFFYPKPRFLLSWSEDKDTQWRLRVERVLGQLDFGNFIATSDLGGSGVSAGNSNLRPDQRDQFELSYEKHFMTKGAIVVTLLHEQIKDVVDLIPVSDGHGNLFDAPGNIGSGTNNQVDVEMTLPLDWMGLTNGLLKTTSIFRSSRVHDPLTGEIRGISAERPQDIELTLTQDIDSLKSTWGIDYFNGWREKYYRLQEYRNRAIPPGLLSVYWEYKPTPDWMLHFEIDNITRFIYDDKHYDYNVSRLEPTYDALEERVVRSQPRLYVELRKTFN